MRLKAVLAVWFLVLIPALLLVFGMQFKQAERTSAEVNSCQVYIDGWVQSYNAWAVTYCQPLTYDDWWYMRQKYGDRWWMPEEQVPWNPDVRVRHFVGISPNGAWSFYEGPWVQLVSAAGCVQLSNPYWQGP